MKLPCGALLSLTLVTVWAERVLGQTFLAAKAVHEVKCRSFLGLFDKCVTIETDRLHSTFTRDKLGLYVFGRPWATASHCTRIDPVEKKCQQSVFISTDREWNRIIWGQVANNFMRIYGTPGTPADGPGHWGRPLGVDITRREGEWHVGFIADSHNNRIVVIAVGYTCKCVKWLGTLDGSESGTGLKRPHDVAWDPADTWSFADDRVFIADTYNHRVVVYRVSLNPAGGTMTKTYLNSFGTLGQGAAQFSGPRGITVRSWIAGPSLLADVYVSDTDNGRVSLWYHDSPNSGTPATPFAAKQSAPIPGSELVGISQAHYGEVIVADRARDVLVKFTDDLAHLKTYGGTPSWSTGNFNDPTDAEVIYHYWQDSYGNLIEEGLPYVQTVEQWTAGTGGQLHQLGVDTEELSVTAGVGGCDATFTFLFTAYGDYKVKVKNSASYVVDSLSRTGVTPGRKSEYWNPTNMPQDTYSWYVEHLSAYGGSWRSSLGPSFRLCPFTVTPSAPSYVTQTGTYSLTGSANDPASGWLWQRRDNGGPWTYWSDKQNSSFVVSAGQYTIEWRLSATSQLRSAKDTGYATTTVCIPSTGCGPPSVTSASPTATGITRFHLTQAPPEPHAPSGVTPISASLVPGLVTGTEARPTDPLQTASLRDAVRRYGITALAFAIPDGDVARVTIHIYDPSGRLLRTLVNEGYSPGAYRVQWDLNDQRGARVGPGVYIAVMQARGFRAMKKLVVVP